MMIDINNRLYIWYNCTFNKQLKQHLTLLNEKVNECVIELQLSKPNSAKLREIKALLIKEFHDCEIKGKKPTFRLTYAAINVQRKINLLILPEKKINAKGKFDLNKLKREYINSLKSHEEDLALKKFLKNSELKKLAREMDKDMENELTLREFARLISFDYRTKILAILSKKGKSADTSNFRDACAALFLLQKNKCFPNAIQKLMSNCQDDRLDFVKANALHYHQDFFTSPEK